MERVVATVPRHCLSLTTAATGLHVGLGMAVAPLPLDGSSASLHVGYSTWIWIHGDGMEAGLDHDT